VPSGRWKTSTFLGFASTDVLQKQPR
jgi:hypothetical protein